MPLKDRTQKLKYDQNFTSTLYYQRKEQGLCTHCGKPTDGRIRCTPCLNKETTRSRIVRMANKKRAIEYLGGKCADCGLKTDFISVYDFHHKEAEDKEANVGRLLVTFRTWEKIQEEIDKCVLLCANCHRIRHEMEGNIIL
jgi:hypothetical protein